MPVTLREVLARPVLAAGRPVVVAGADGLDRQLRWVHVSELPDIARLLRGGELVLTTGVALPDSSGGLAAYVTDLAEAGAAALVVELGRRFHEIPASMVAAADRHHLPVVALRRTVRFVEVTEEVHGLILDEQHEWMRRSEQAHREFTALSVEGASVQRIVDKAAELAGDAVVLEDVGHHVLAYACRPHEEASLLEDWEARSRAATGAHDDASAGPEGWLVTPVGPRDQRWGRLVVPAPSRPVRDLRMLLERAAEALAINRLVERDRAGLRHQAQRGLLTELVLGRADDESHLRARAEALGLPAGKRVYVGLAVQARWPPGLDPVAAESRDRMLAEAVTQAAAAAGLPSLVAGLRSGQALALLSVRDERSLAGLLDTFAAALRAALERSAWAERHAVGLGRAVPTLTEAAASLAESGHVAEAGLAMSASLPYYRSADVRLRGLLALLRDDPRLQAFAEAELGPLLRHDRERGTDLLGTLRHYFAAGGNKTALARATHLSRPALYARLAQLERVLGVSLGDPESAAALHLALVAREVDQALATTAH